MIQKHHCDSHYDIQITCAVNLETCNMALKYKLLGVTHFELAKTGAGGTHVHKCVKCCHLPSYGEKVK